MVMPPLASLSSLIMLQEKVSQKVAVDPKVLLSQYIIWDSIMESIFHHSHVNSISQLPVELEAKSIRYPLCTVWPAYVLGTVVHSRISVEYVKEHAWGEKKMLLLGLAAGSIFHFFLDCF